MLKEIDTYLDILAGERDFPEIGTECLETCPPDCEEHKWYCVYWIRLNPQKVLYSDTYYDYKDGVNNADVYTDGYVGVSRRLEGRYREHKYEDTKENCALLKELIEWYGDNIQLLILEEGLSKTKAYEVETSYRPYPNIGWNKAKGGDAPSPLTKESRQKIFQTRNPKQYKWIFNTVDGVERLVPSKELDKYLQNSVGWRLGRKNCTSPRKIIRKKLCFNFPSKNKRFVTAKNLKQQLVALKRTECVNPDACCLDIIPIDILVNGFLQYNQTRRKTNSPEEVMSSMREKGIGNFGRDYKEAKLIYTFQNGKQRKELSKTEWLDIFQCSSTTFNLYVNTKYTIEINGKVYKAYKKKYKDTIKLRPVIDINHSIHNWELIKKESTRDYDKRNRYI